MKKLKLVGIGSVLLLIFVFLVSMAFPLSTFQPPVSAAAGLAPPFKDVPTSHWSIKHIVKMNLRGVVTGYQDGSFHPDRGVSQLEAVLMAVRNMEDQPGLQLMDTNQPLNLDVPAWARDNFRRELLYALEHRLIIPQENNFQATDHASRAWMTQLMVRMIGKDAEAVALADQNPDFTDADQIPAWARGYVNSAIKYQLISGFPDNSFKPAQFITRAQAVALLSRSEAHLGLDERMPRGQVQSVKNDTITLRTSGTSQSYTLDADTWVFDAGDRLVDRGNIKSGDYISIFLDGNLAIIVDISGEQTWTGSQTGMISHLSTDSMLLVIEDNEQRLHTYPLSSETLARDVEGNPIPLEQLAAGLEVEIKINSDGTVASLQVRGNGEHPASSGIIYTLDPASRILIIKSPLGAFHSYRFDDATRVIVSGQRFPSVTDLAAGDEVNIKTENQLITEIELLKARQELSLSGKIAILSLDRRLLVLEEEAAGVKTYPVAEKVEITIKGREYPLFSDLVVGDEIEILVREGQIAAIEVKSRSYKDTLRGTVVAVDIDNEILVIRNEDDELVSYEVSEQARFFIDDTRYNSLSRVKKDMKVELELFNNRIIYLKGSSIVEGRVLSINEVSKKITVRTDTIESQTYALDPNVKVHIEGMTRPQLKDIRSNDPVGLKMERDIVNTILVRQVITFEIIEVLSASERLRIGNEKVAAKYLSLSQGDVELVIPGIANPSIDDFAEGQTVSVTFLGYQPVKVEVVSP